eukprot:gene6247-7241_t
MNNTFKALAVLALIATVAFAAVTDEEERFSNQKIVRLNSITPIKDIHYQTVAFNSTNMNVFLDDGKYLIAPLLNITEAKNDQTLSFLSIAFNFKSDSVYSVAQYTQDFIYALGTIGLYKIRISDNLALTQDIGTEGFGQTPFNSAFVNGNQFYFVGTSPPKMVRFTCDDQMPTDPSNPFKVVFSDVALSFQPASVTYDSVNALAFIGGPNGELSVYDMASNAIISTLANPVASYVRQVGIVDPIKKELYTCSGSSQSAYMDIYSYGTSTITQINAQESIPIIQASSCTAAAIDAYQGQVFFVGPASSSLAAIGLTVRGERQAHYFFDQDVDSSAVTAYVDNTTSTLTTVTLTTVTSLSYASTCIEGCNGHGQCIDNVCHCQADYTIESFCGSRNCIALNNCSGNGTCSDGTCLCDAFWMTAPDCSVRSCQSNCSGRGTCSMEPDFTCTCNEDFVGSYCEQTAPSKPCDYFKSSSDCVDRTYCGWCESTDTCQFGNRYGPEDGFCRTWYYGQNVEIGVVILAAIFIGLIGILYVIDIVTTIPLDIERAKNYEVEFRTGTYPKASHEEASILWWRDQRSAKAWTLMDQFQFISLISHIGVIFPSRFLNFTEYLDWTNLGIPFPPSINVPTEHFASRNLFTYAQYNNILESGSEYHLANILFWFIILAAAFIVPLTIAFIILNFIESLVHWKEVIRNRLIHVTIRILWFSYIGVVMAACFSIVTPPHEAKLIAPGAIIVALYGIGFPLAIAFFLRVPESRLHNPTFKQQFGCLYVNFKPKTDHRFILFTFAKRFIMAGIVGILAFKPEPVYPLAGKDLAVPIAQAAIIALVIIVYVVILAIRKPYFDHYHLWLEYFLAVINLATVGLCLSHIKSPSVVGELLVGLVQALALVACIAAYIISWLQMRSTFLAKISNAFSCCGKKKSTKVNLQQMDNK